MVATDADGQRDGATKSVTVTNDTATEPSTEPTPDDGFLPDVLGPRVVTESDDLTGTYELSDGRVGTWQLNGRHVGNGESVTLRFEAGVHELYAAPSGDSGGIAEFTDDSRSVVADPAPELTVNSISNGSVPTVDAYATDALGNLESIVVFVDGEVVQSITRGGLEYSENDGAKLSLVERLPSVEPGEHSITVRATDSRGQTDSFETTVEVPGPPEVLSAGFVNDGPIDQYHPRINESRYTAVYEVVVDLNGVDSEELYWEAKLSSAKTTNITTKVIAEDKFVIELHGYKREIGDISSDSIIEWGPGNYRTHNGETLQVTPAPPEVRLSVIAPQTRHESSRTGMKLDASRSFDPDGTPLRFRWSGVQGKIEILPMQLSIRGTLEN